MSSFALCKWKSTNTMAPCGPVPSVVAAIGFYQMLDHVAGNRGNEPLKPRAVTLSRTDLISFV